MGQMTAGQVLAQVDDLLPNSYPGEQKRRWLRQAEGFVLEEVVRVHEGGQGAVLPGELTDAAELLAPAPYDGLYRHMWRPRSTMPTGSWSGITTPWLCGTTG